MSRMLRYILTSICLLLTLNVAVAQEGSKDETQKETAQRASWFKGVILDVDLVEPLWGVFSTNHQGFNASVSADIKHAFFPTFLAGYASYDASSDYSHYVEKSQGYAYKVNGPYFKVGLDFNLIRDKKSTKKCQPIAALGLRYAFSPYHFEIDNCSVSRAGWGDNAQFSVDGSTFAQWGEFVASLKAPVYKSLYLGFEGCYKWSFSPDVKHFSDAQTGNCITVNQTYAPGFGDSKGTCWGMRYFVSFYF